MRVPGFVRPSIVAALLTVTSAALASAQTTIILPSTRPLLTGPLSFYPTIALRDAGSDSNVFNDATGPKGDYTFTLVPRLYVVAPFRNTRFVGTGFGNLVYYQTYKDQQSIGSLFEGRWEVISPGWRPFAAAVIADRREQRGFEIDARVRQQQMSLSVGTELDLGAKTALVAWVRRRAVGWDRDAQYLGELLSEQLDHRSDTFAGGARVRLTPLTTLSLTTEVEQDRFERIPLRDADKLFIGPSVDFDTGAAVVGHARVGYQRFTPLSSQVADYRGLATSASLRYTFRDLTELKFDIRRDVDYSYDPLQPYYLESGGLVTVTQHVAGPLEAIALIERRDLRNQPIGERSFDGRREITRRRGGGLALHISNQVRFELTFERIARTSSEPGWRNYERRRLFASATYGL